MKMPPARAVDAARAGRAASCSKIPIIYLGAGTCGLASGMDQLIPVVRDLLAQHGHDSDGEGSRLFRPLPSRADARCEEAGPPARLL